MSDHPQQDKNEWKFHIKPIIQKLEVRAQELNKDTRPMERLSYLRLYAEELAGTGAFKDDFLTAILSETSPIGQPIIGGQLLPVDLFDNKVPFVWGDLLMAKSWTLFSAKPKAGKSAIAVGLITALLNGEQSYLNQDLENTPDFVLIIGNDMSEDQWYQYFRNTGCLKRLEDGNYVLSDRLMIYCRGSALQLNDSGIETIKGLCKPHKHSLILIDTYRSAIRSLRLKESDAGFCKPIEDLMQALASANLQCTGLVNHHSPKASYDSVIEDAASGSNALSGAFDGLLNLRSAYPRAIKQSKAATFFLESKNRGNSDNSLLIQRGDSNIWEYLQAGNDFAQMLHLFEAMEKLTPHQAKVIDALLVAAEMNREIDTIQLAQQLNMELKAVQRALRQLDSRGMAERTSRAKRNPLGGMISAKWKAAEWTVSYVDDSTELEGSQGPRNAGPQGVPKGVHEVHTSQQLQKSPPIAPDPLPESEGARDPGNSRNSGTQSDVKKAAGIDKAPPVGTEIEIKTGIFGEERWKQAKVVELHDSLTFKALLTSDGLAKTYSNLRMGLDARLIDLPPVKPSCGF